MAVSSTEKANHVLNVPNLVTSARLVLAVVLFVFLAWRQYPISLVLFLVAAATDWVDGFYARRYGQVTQLGRILDPFADKLIICGTFVFLVAVPHSGVQPWMAVVIIGRELLVTALRSFLEEKGADFSANMAGKLKMVFQCAAVALSILVLSYLDPASELKSDPAVWRTEPPSWLTWSLSAAVWSAVVLTVYSGIGYIFAAIRLMRNR